MSMNAIVGASQAMQKVQMSAVMEVAAARRQLDQQELNGQSALKLMDAAAVPIDPNLGQNINIRV